MNASEAAEILAGEGISCEVIDLQTINPWDFDTVAESVEKTGRLLTVEEGPLSFGVGAEIAARAARDLFDYLDAPIERIGAADTPIPFSPVLEQATLPDADKIALGVRRLLGRP